MIDWQRKFDLSIRPGLDRMCALMDQLGHPERELAVVHIAGTNGKGSTAAMIGAGLASQGLQVGMTVSPDLGRINERILFNQTPISDPELDALAAELERAQRRMSEPPTFFEAMIAMAFLAFRRRQIDVAVVEVGLGGRWDATNVVPAPLLSVITPIHYDHMDLLGPRIEDIAGEKAGILKPGSRLVLANQPFPAAGAVVLERARSLNVPVRRPEGVSYNDQGRPVWRSVSGFTVRTGLLGLYQAENLATAWTAIEQLAELGWISDVAKAAHAMEAVSWPGRFQVISDHPRVVIDGAHNLHGAEALAATLKVPPWGDYTWHLLFSGLNDKPVDQMLEVLVPVVRSVILTSFDSDRAAKPEEVLEKLKPDSKFSRIDDAASAFAQIRDRVAVEGPGSALLITGSLAFLAHLRRSGIIP